ncbi:MAG: response regulator transcription factor [Rhodopila sp.]|jgi:two-component system response regulator FixJ
MAEESLLRALRGANYQVQGFTAQTLRDVAPLLLPGCVTLMLKNPGAASDVALLRELKARRSDLPVIVIGNDNIGVKEAVHIMKAGATDCLAGITHMEAVLAAVAAVLTEVRETANRGNLVELTRARVAEMSSRELQVLQGLLVGATNKEMGSNLKTSPRTVELH